MLFNVRAFIRAPSGGSDSNAISKERIDNASQKRERYFSPPGLWQARRKYYRLYHWSGAWLAPSMLRTSKLTAPDFERLARTPWPIASLASSGMRPLSSTSHSYARGKPLGCGERRWRIPPRHWTNSCQIRTASMRARGGSTPKRRGGSPLSTQRQNFFSAVNRRWVRSASRGNGDQMVATSNFSGLVSCW